MNTKVLIEVELEGNKEEGWAAASPEGIQNVVDEIDGVLSVKLVEQETVEPEEE